MTADELLHMPGDDRRYELIGGELITASPAGFEHGLVVAELTIVTGQFVKTARLGRVQGAETGFLLARNPDTVRAPDLSFMRQDRLTAGEPVEGFFPGAPDLAVEVVSPNDPPDDVEAKARAWIAGGTFLVWVVDPRTRTVSVYRPGNSVETLQGNDLCEGHETLPGFRCQVSEFFEPLVPSKT